MKLKTTLVLLIAAVGLGTYISLYELKQPAPEKRDRLSRRILRVDPDSVLEIRLKRPNGTLRLIRAQSGWRLEPGGWLADSKAVTDTLLQTSSLIASRIIRESEDSAIDYGAFGLAEPDWEMILATGSDTHQLRFGETTPVGSGRYVRLDDAPFVAVLSLELFQWVSQPKEVFRETRLVPLDRFTLTEIALEEPESRLRLKLTDEQWRLTEPVDGPANWGAVNTLMDALAKLEIERFLESGSEENPLLQHLQDNPTLRISLVFGKPPRTTNVSFGNPLPDNAEHVLAMRDREPLLYAVSAKTVEALKLSPEALKAKEDPEGSTAARTESQEEISSPALE